MNSMQEIMEQLDNLDPLELQVLARDVKNYNPEKPELKTPAIKIKSFLSSVELPSISVTVAKIPDELLPLSVNSSVYWMMNALGEDQGLDDVQMGEQFKEIFVESSLEDIAAYVNKFSNLVAVIDKDKFPSQTNTYTKLSLIRDTLLKFYQSQLSLEDPSASKNLQQKPLNPREPSRLGADIIEVERRKAILGWYLGHIGHKLGSNALSHDPSETSSRAVDLQAKQKSIMKLIEVLNNTHLHPTEKLTKFDELFKSNLFDIVKRKDHKTVAVLKVLAVGATLGLTYRLFFGSEGKKVARLIDPNISFKSKD